MANGQQKWQQLDTTENRKWDRTMNSETCKSHDQLKASGACDTNEESGTRDQVKRKEHMTKMNWAKHVTNCEAKHMIKELNKSCEQNEQNRSCEQLNKIWSTTFGSGMRMDKWDELTEKENGEVKR